MTKALRVTILVVGSTLALIIFVFMFSAAMTFLEIKGDVGLLVLALLFICWAATYVALKRWLLPPTTEPEPQPEPLPWWFRHLYFPLATIILYIPVAALWLYYWERRPLSVTAILIAVAYNISVTIVGGVLIRRWLRNRAEGKL